MKPAQVRADTHFGMGGAPATPPMRVTAEALLQAGWTNSWIGGVRRWHHKRFLAHFLTLDEAKTIYRDIQMGNPYERY